MVLAERDHTMHPLVSHLCLLARKTKHLRDISCIFQDYFCSGKYGMAQVVVFSTKTLINQYQNFCESFMNGIIEQE